MKYFLNKLRNAFIVGVVLCAGLPGMALAVQLVDAPSNGGIVYKGTVEMGIAWTDNSNNENGYTVEYATDGVNFVTFPQAGSLLDNTTSFNAFNLTSNTKYWFRVAAYVLSAGGGQRIYSTYATVPATFTLATTPVAPALSNPSASGFTIAISQDSNNSTVSYALKVTDPANNVYYVQSNGILGAQPFFTTKQNWGGGAVLGGLNSNTTYSVSVQAKNGDGVLTSFSPISSITTVTNVPAAPTNGGAWGAPLTNSQLTIHWEDNANNETGFRVEISTDGVTYATAAGGASLAPNTTSFVATGLAVNTRYWLRVESFIGSSFSAPLVIANAYTLPNTPLAPSVGNPTATGFDMLGIVTNGNPADIVYAINIVAIPNDGNNIQYALQSDGTMSNQYVYKTAAEWGRITVKNLLPNTMYQVLVITRSNQSGFSPPSSPEVSITTLVANQTIVPTAPAIPTNTVISNSSVSASCPALNPGDEVKVAGQAAIYLLNAKEEIMAYYIGDDYKTWHAGYGGYISISDACYTTLKAASAEPLFVNIRPGTEVLKRTSSAQWYVVLPGNTIVKISQAAARVLYGVSVKPRVISNIQFLSYTRTGADITTATAHPGMLVKNNGKTWYVGTNNTLREVTDVGFVANGFGTRFIHALPSSAIGGLVAGTVIDRVENELLDKTQNQ